MISRAGNKTRLAGQIVALMPPHKIYVEPFFGAGGMFFNKPLAKHNFVNDLDNEIMNFWQVMRERPQELIAELEALPLHQSIFEHYKSFIPKDPVERALRLLFLSNSSYMGVKDTFHIYGGNMKAVFLKSFEEKKKKLFANTVFACKPYKDFFLSIHLRSPEREIPQDMFIYCDPPYCDKNQPYNAPQWGLDDLEGLLDFLIGYGAKFACSEYSTKEVVDIAESKGLQVHYLGELQTMKNRQTEILITNYQPIKTLF